MPLIERFTPGGNLYPDGGSTFVVLVDLFRKLAENRDTRDAAAKTAWEQADAATLNAAKSDATTKANAAESRANAYTNAALADVDVDLTGYATENYASTAAQTAESNANTYTDDTFLATPAGQSSDAAIDAGVDRAVAGGRVVGNARVEALEVGRVIPETDMPGWLSAKLATAVDGDTIDLMGRDITLTTTLNLSKRVVLRNGVLRAANTRVALVNADGVELERMTFIRTGTGRTDEGAAVYAQARFRSKGCHYLSDAGSALVLQHGTCNYSKIKGGSGTSYSRRQNACGVYVSAGNVGNYGIEIDGVSVTGGLNCGPDGIILYDDFGCVVKNCPVRRLRALPDVTIPQTWTLTATPNVWESAPVRTDGPTRVVLVNSTEWTEDITTPTQPSAANTWGISGDRVYLNTATDPNTMTVVSRIVSGYGITLYCTAGTWRTMSNNLVSHNRVEDTDGFGIYLQVGDVVATGNSTDSNVLIDVCLKGEQSTKLPFGGIGIIGGKGTSLNNDVIDGAGSPGFPAFGVNAHWATDGAGDYSTGTMTGVRVRDVTGHGLTINGGNWQLTNVTASRCSSNGFLFMPENDNTVLDVALNNCEASYNTTHGVNFSGSSRPGCLVRARVFGGYYRKNGSRGIQADRLQDLQVGGGVILDANPSYGVNVSTGCVNVHIDGATFANGPGLAVDNSVVKLTTGRLVWGVNVTTKIGGTGAARVVDIFDTPIATSPDGTRYKLTVPNGGGAVTATAL